MERVISNSELSDTHKNKKLQAFFAALPEVDPQNVAVIDRAIIDDLIEAGLSLIDLMNVFVSKGFLLHGSSVSGIDELQPRQGSEKDDIPENKRFAIYAITIPAVALFRGLVSGIEGSTQFSVDTHVQDNGKMEESIKFCTSFNVPEHRKGWVYVLPSSTFEEAGGPQFTSPVAVRPCYAIPVQLSDFPYEIRNNLEE